MSSLASVWVSVPLVLFVHLPSDSTDKINCFVQESGIHGNGSLVEAYLKFIYLALNFEAVFPLALSNNRAWQFSITVHI